MKKLVALFVLAVLIPSMILGWLAFRSLRDQEIVVERQRALLHQAATDSIAADMNIFMDDIRVYFRNLVDELVVERGIDAVSGEFDELIRQRWGQVEVGAVVSEDGALLSPKTNSVEPKVQAFIDMNDDFLSNRTEAEVYQVARQNINDIVVAYEEAPTIEKSSGSLFDLGGLKRRGGREQPSAAPPAPASAPASASAPARARASSPAPVAEVDSVEMAVVAVADEDKATSNALRAAGGLEEKKSEPAYRAKVSVVKEKLTSRLAENRQEYAVANASAAPEDQKLRNIQPQSAVAQDRQEEGAVALAKGAQVGQSDSRSNWSMLVTQRGEFQDLLGENEEGAFSRFLQNKLNVLLWYRPVGFEGRVFCAQLDLELLKEEIGKIVSDYPVGKSQEICVALIDEAGAAVSRNMPSFEADWRKPFVASEVGEILPHWEVGAYLVYPGSLTQAASQFRFALGLMILVLIAAIGFGSLLIFWDLARQTKLARQKTDFVSNVSHELKTPLTSIRMFSDLLSADGEVGVEKRSEYAGIISSEAARLTRLINNILDFSRLERGDKKYDFRRLDLGELVKETLDHYREHLVSKGYRIDFDAENGFGIEVEGDRDALAQILLNLVSNAEKYGGDAKEIAVQIVPVEGKAEVRVMDRGPGVGRKNQERIFKKFYRADDSLASGIQGSGLGLSLARQIARSHRGDVVYRSREGGGSCFVMVVPLRS